MAEVVRLRCDSCGIEEGVRPYRLSTPETGLNRALALDLCDNCAEPLQRFEGMGRTVSRRRTPEMRHVAAPEPLRARVYSQEELDHIEEEDSANDEKPPTDS